jgi:uncharacterized protein YuzE
MEKGIEVSYEEVDDILYMGKKGKVKFSVDVALPSGDIVIDIGFDGLVKGIEIMYASDFFSLSKGLLSKIRGGKMSFVYGPSYVAVSISLDSLKQPVKGNVVIPFNKKIALSA